MNLITSIWSHKKVQALKQKAEETAKAAIPLNERLSDEIKAYRQNKAEFEKTNDRQTYVVLIFSCDDDKNEFLRFLQYKKETYIDGYEFAKRINAEPCTPSVKLKRPLN